VSRPVVGVTASLEEMTSGDWTETTAGVPATYVAAVQRAGGRAVLLPPDDDTGDALDGVDALLVTGAAGDTDPATYGADPHPKTAAVAPERDRFELAVTRAALEGGVPVLGVCRGMQVVNVALGGTLDTHVHAAEGRMDHRARRDVPYDEMYGPRHKVTFLAGGEFARILGKTETQVNSLHWQGIARPAERIQVEGRAGDGVIEAVSLKDHAGFCLGAQWHPEFRVTENPDSMALFKAFGAATRARRQQRLSGGKKADAASAGAAA
jgi:putative glutamine amidotransferase